MARIKKGILRNLFRLLLAGARRGILPSGMVFGIAGILASGLAASDNPPITCYVPVPNYYGPMVTRITAFPNPTEGAKTVKVVATLVGYMEGQRVAGAKLYARKKSGDAVPFYSEAMKPVDGAFDSDSEDVYLDLEVSGWAGGSYWIYVSGYNQAGEGGISYSLNLEVTPGE